MWIDVDEDRRIVLRVILQTERGLRIWAQAELINFRLVILRRLRERQPGTQHNHYYDEEKAFTGHKPS
jgi:hypothetical protein